MSVASHLAVSPARYDVRIRSLIGSRPRGFARDLDLWLAHLGKTFGSRTRGRRVYESWADEDVYVPLAEEVRLLERAGFAVDVPWRRSPFAVIVGCRHP